MPAGTLTRVASTVTSEVASGNITMAFSSGTVPAGDLLIACIVWRGSADFTKPADWEIAHEETSGNSTTSPISSAAAACGIYYKLVTVPEPADAGWTWTRTGGFVANGKVMGYRGGNLADIFHTAVGNSLGAGAVNISTGAGITTDTTNQLLIMLAGAGSQNAYENHRAATDPVAADWDEFSDSGQGDNVAISVRMSISNAAKLTAGATGIFTADNGVSSRHTIAVAAFRAALSVSVTPSNANAKGATVNPTVRKGSLVIGSAAAIAKGAVVAPSVTTGSLSISPAAAEAKGDVVSPAVLFSSQVIEPDPAIAAGDVVAPDVKGELIIIPDAASARGEVAMDEVEIALGPLFFPAQAASNSWTSQEPLG